MFRRALLATPSPECTGEHCSPLPLLLPAVDYGDHWSPVRRIWKSRAGCASEQLAFWEEENTPKTPFVGVILWWLRDQLAET